MADAREEQITAAVKTAVTDLATTKGNVFRGRAYPLESSNLPALLVYMGPDTPAVELLENFIDWQLGIAVEVYVQTVNGDIDTALAKIRKEVHAAIMGTPQLGLSFVIDTVPILAAEPEIEGEGKNQIGRRRLEFVVTYRTSRTDISA